MTGILSIHQPSYFPWFGLLNKITSSDVYMVMDEVALSDNAYQHRNLFLTSQGKVKYLTIPFVKKNYLKRPFKDIEVANQEWRIKHFNFITNNYRKHPFAKEILPYIEVYYLKEYMSLGEAVLASMKLSFELLGVTTKVIFQSDIEYDRSLTRGDLVFSLAKAVGARCYLSGKGAQSYLDESLFNNGIELCFDKFTHPVYTQKSSQLFQPGLSCIDALFNVGIKGARNLLYLNKGGNEDCVSMGSHTENS